MAYHDWVPKLSGKNSSIKNIKLELSNQEIKSDELTNFNVNFRISGDLRDCLEQESCEEAYNLGDTYIRITCTIDLFKKKLSSNKKIKTDKFVRKATFYWTRNPELPYRIWILVVQENYEPIVPQDILSAKSFMFDFNKSYNFTGSDLGSGTHEIMAKVKIKWTRHSLIGQSSVSQTSNVVKIVVN